MKVKHLYLHIPFCKKKCPYCDFYSSTNQNFQDSYTDALLKSFSKYNNVLSDKLDTIYMGGGTPSLLSYNNMEKLLTKLHPYITDNTEFTIEINPCKITKEKLQLYRNYGINRASLGVQSFNDSELKILERIHTESDIYTAYDLIRNSGIENVSIDLIVAIPTQTEKSLDRSISKALKLSPKHISVYVMTYYEDTEFFDRVAQDKITPTDDDISVDLFTHLIKRLDYNGYKRYEISNFSKAGYESKHNLNTWNHGEYLGLGASASSHFNNRRKKFISNIEKFILNPDTLEEDYAITSQDDKLNEFIMLGLRTCRGISLDEIKNRFKVDYYSLNKAILDRYISDGFMSIFNGRLSLTYRGMEIFNSVVSEILI